MENILMEVEDVKKGLESQLCNAQENVESLQKKVSNLEKELNDEIRSRKEAESQYLELKRENEIRKG
jgi:Skp family chaperone for outer membrane proteins